MIGPDTHSDAPSPASGFPGYSERAPLDLSGLTDAETEGLLSRLTGGTFRAFSDTATAVGYCARPVRLVGSSTTYAVDQATGEVGPPLDVFSSEKDTPLGVLYRACGNRRADVCPACSRVYARDTFEMIRAGLVGGKTVPETVADNPLLFATFTAPSFGDVHTAHTRNGKPARCRPRDKTKVCEHGRPRSCWPIHDRDDPVTGSPLCEDCHDWHSAVIWQWWAPELWRRTTIALKRHLAAALGVKEEDLKRVCSPQYAKVAEYQARGLIHFHALVRLDGPDGPGSPTPLDGADLAQLLHHAARSVEYTAPAVDADDIPRLLRWGRQLDVRVVRGRARTDDPDGPVTPEQVAGYLAKYATKDANSIRDHEHPRPHLTRLAQTCRELAARAIAEDQAGTPYRLLAKWAHMLGFRGHFSSKSRRYSITLGRLRRARQRFQALAADSRRDGVLLDTLDLETRLLADDEETTLVVGSWTYQGTGWTNPGDEALALAAAARAREYDQWRAQNKHTETRLGSENVG